MATVPLSMSLPIHDHTIPEPSSAPRAKGSTMRRIAVLLSLALGPLTAACADQSSFGPSQLEQLDDNTVAESRASTDGGTSGGSGGKKVGGSAGGVKGVGK
jgi:hypothetical protein